MFLDRADEEFNAVDLDGVQQLCQLAAQFRWYAPGAAVGDDPVRVHRTEVAARGDILGAEFEIHAESFERAAANLVLDRVIPEDGEVTGPAAHGDARPGRLGQPQGGSARQRVQVGSAGRLELGLAARFHRQPAQPIQDDQRDFRLRRGDQFF